MTLTAEQSSNKSRYEAAPTSEIIQIIRIAMGEGCIRPCHVFDAVDELICRVESLEGRTMRNCDVGTPEEQGERFIDYCCSTCDGSNCKHGTYREDEIYKCAIKWAQTPYEANEKGEGDGN